VLLFLFDKENENGVSNGVLTKDAFFDYNRIIPFPTQKVNHF